MGYVEAEFPAASVPVSPILSLSTPGKRYTSGYSILDLKHTLLTSNCRNAIALALEQIGISKNDEVLVPAYHCSSMIDPVRWLQAKPIFYKINQDLAIDLDDVEKKLNDKTRVLLITHYFGFPQDSKMIALFCQKNNIRLIEDCAHTFYGSVNGLPVGAYGDYAVASAMKFFPICDGGVLASNTIPLGSIQTKKLSMGIQLRFLTNILDRAIAFGRLRWLTPFQFLKELLTKIFCKIDAKQSVETKKSLPSASYSGFGFEPEWIHKRMSFASRFIMYLSSTEKQIQKRRSNYLRYLEKFSTKEDVVPLYNSLQSNIVPYVFPMYFKYPMDDFVALKRLGVPIIRFGEFLEQEVDSSVCEVSVEYSKHVLQFPCHQELKDEEISWIIESIDKVLGTRRNSATKY